MRFIIPNVRTQCCVGNEKEAGQSLNLTIGDLGHHSFFDGEVQALRPVVPGDRIVLTIFFDHAMRQVCLFRFGIGFLKGHADEGIRRGHDP